MKPITKEELYSIKKAVVFPFCMTRCLTAKNHGFYRCSNCNKCQISFLKKRIKQGYEVLLVGSKTMAKILKEFYDNNHKVIAIGVLCKEEIEEKKKQLKGYELSKIFHHYDTYIIPKICKVEGENREIEDKKPEINEEKLINKILTIEKKI